MQRVAKGKEKEMSLIGSNAYVPFAKLGSGQCSAVIVGCSLWTHACYILNEGCCH